MTDVNSDITPITGEKIETVEPAKWDKMNIDRLWEQRIILNDRAIKALQCGQAIIAKQVQQGIDRIDILLHIKTAEAAASIEKPPREGTLR